VPYHVQLFFQAVREECRSDANLVTPEKIDAAFHTRLASVNGGPYLDHYAERLDHVMDESDAALAKLILSFCSQGKNGAAIKHLIASCQCPPERFMAVTQTLQEDGYLLEVEGALMFRSNLVREFWKRVKGRR
jgi:hypothetical protein